MNNIKNEKFSPLRSEWQPSHSEHLLDALDVNKPQTLETEKELNYLESAKKVGNYYTSLVKSFIGKGEINFQAITDLRHPVKNKLTTITQRAKTVLNGSIFWLK